MVFSCIEDYIEFIGGIKDKNCKPTGAYWSKPVVNLANYDVGFITSINEQLATRTPLSDRQAVLAYKLIEKYERQLLKLGVEQPTHRNHRLGIRELDRSSKVFINEAGKVCVKFPYNEQIINAIKLASKDSQGAVQWDPGSKTWQFALTEYNVSWAYAIASAHNMTVDASVAELFELITEVEKTPYEIKLQVTDGKCEITNIPPSMHDFITQNVGFDDLYKLIDYAGVLGYTIDQNILDAFISQHGEAFTNMCSKRYIDYPPGAPLAPIMDWVKVVNRYPVCVYNPNFIKSVPASFATFFEPDEIQIIDMKTNTNLDEIVIDPKIKLVYTNKVIPQWKGRIPLLISYANLMHGTAKRSFLDKADKVVYYCETLPKRI
jgi:hypothetical protein